MQALLFVNIAVLIIMFLGRCEMFNQFTGIGNLAADVESRFTTNGKQVASFTVCCDSGYGDNKKTEYVKCIAWEKLAEIAAEYLSKGKKCMIQGIMQTRKWQDQSGNDRYSTEIIVRELKLLSTRGESSGSGKSFQGAPDQELVPF